MTFFLGLDAGGSHSRARLIDSSGRVLGTGSAGTANTRIGTQNSIAALETAWNAAITEAQLSEREIASVSAGVGIAGYKRAGAAEAFAAAAFPFRAIRFASDAVIANLGAHDGGGGATLILGTGSIGIIRTGDADITLGGYGFPVSDEGSGAWLGLEAVRHAVRAHDGRAQRGILANIILKKFSGDPVQIVGWTDHATPTDYAGFAPDVMQAAQAGDEGAAEIAARAARIVDDFVAALIDRGAPSVCLMGGLASALEPWLSAGTRAHLQAPKSDALTGALLLAGWRSQDGATASGPSPR